MCVTGTGDRRNRRLCRPGHLGLPGLLLLLLCSIGVVPVVADDQDQRPEQEQKAQSDQAEPKQDKKPPPAGPAGPASKRPPARSGAAPGPLRFTDFDLEKYHKPLPAEEDEAAEEVQDLESSSGEAPGVDTAGPRPVVTRTGAPPPRRASAPRPPNPPATPPLEDPLKPFKDREAKEKFRSEQIQRARDRIAEIQSRLDYLHAKRDAILNPAPLLAGQTRAQGDPGKPPPPPTPIQGPGKGLTPIPGPGRVPVGGFFPNLPPPQTDQDKENDKRLKTRDLVALVQDEIKGLEAELEQAQGELISIQTRFAQEAGPR